MLGGRAVVARCVDREEGGVSQRAKDDPTSQCRGRKATGNRGEKLAPPLAAPDNGRIRADARTQKGADVGQASLWRTLLGTMIEPKDKLDAVADAHELVTHVSGDFMNSALRQALSPVLEGERPD